MRRLFILVLLLAAPAWADPAPGTRLRVGIGDLPPPYATPSRANPADVVARPPGT